MCICHSQGNCAEKGRYGDRLQGWISVSAWHEQPRKYHRRIALDLGHLGRCELSSNYKVFSACHAVHRTRVFACSHPTPDCFTVPVDLLLVRNTEEPTSKYSSFISILVKLKSAQVEHGRGCCCRGVIVFSIGCSVMIFDDYR